MQPATLSSKKTFITNLQVPRKQAEQLVLPWAALFFHTLPVQIDKQHASKNLVGLLAVGDNKTLMNCFNSGVAFVVATVAHMHGHKHRRMPRGAALRRFATNVEMETKTGLAPWEIEEETEDERQARYKREAEEMKLKWDARRLEEKQSVERRIAFANKERERQRMYGPRDLIMDAYEARMYEEARVIEVRRKQREVYERTKALKLGRPLPPKGKPYVTLKPLPMEPPKPEEFDISGRYDPEEDITAQKYVAPENYVSPTGPAPPPRHLRGMPRAAWEDPPYMPPNPNARVENWPKPGSLPARQPAKPRPAPTPKPAAVADVQLEEEKEDEKEAEEVAAIEEASNDTSNLPRADEARVMKVPELKAKLKELGLPQTGTKKVLLARLLDAIEG